MLKSTALKEYKKKIKQYKKYSKKYFEDSAPIVSDHDFDSLKEECIGELFKKSNETKNIIVNYKLFLKYFNSTTTIEIPFDKLDIVKKNLIEIINLDMAFYLIHLKS